MNKQQVAMIAMVFNGKNINIFLILIGFVCGLTPFLAHCIVTAHKWLCSKRNGLSLGFNLGKIIKT
jgi:hypothetical protein